MTILLAYPNCHLTNNIYIYNKIYNWVLIIIFWLETYFNSNALKHTLKWWYLPLETMYGSTEIEIELTLLGLNEIKGLEMIFS